MNRRMIAAVACACGLAAGCGEDDEAAAPATKTSAAKPAPASTVIEVTASESGAKAFRFDVKSLEAKAGMVEFRFTNGDTVAHNIRIQKGAKCCDPANDIGGTNTIDGSAKETARVELASGRYWFLCSIGGHYDGDLGKMKGRLVVE